MKEINVTSGLDVPFWSVSCHCAKFNAALVQTQIKVTVNVHCREHDLVNNPPKIFEPANLT